MDRNKIEHLKTQPKEIKPETGHVYRVREKGNNGIIRTVTLFEKITKAKKYVEERYGDGEWQTGNHTKGYGFYHYNIKSKYDYECTPADVTAIPLDKVSEMLRESLRASTQTQENLRKIAR